MAGHRERLLEKLKKLRAMAQDRAGNPNEVAAAGARMTELMLEFGITEAELAAAVIGPAKAILHHGKKLPQWMEILVGTVAAVVGCRAIGEILGKVHTYYVIGPQLTVEGVVYQFKALVSDIERLQNESWGSRRNSRGWLDFCLGAALIVTERLEATRKRVVRQRTDAGDTKALVHLEKTVTDQEVRQVLNPDAPDQDLHIREAEQVTSSDIKDRDALEWGYTLGANIPLAAEKSLGAEKTGLAGGR